VKIELEIKRKDRKTGKPGTEVVLDDKTYFFAPEDGDINSPHVCTIQHGPHLKKLLAIDCYLLAEDDGATADEQDEFDKLDAELKADEAKKQAEADAEAANKISAWPEITEIDVTDKKTWPNKRLNQYVEAVIGINPISKVDIRTYGEELYNIVLPSTIRSPGPLLRALIEAIQEVKAGKLVDGEDTKTED
jgi:hypothetical protein